MKKTWRESSYQVPNDDFLVLVSTFDGEKSLARYQDDVWIDEFNNRIIMVEFWMPIPITPNE